MLSTHALGSTGLTVTPIGIGLAALGRPAYIDLGRAGDLGEERDPEAMRARSFAVLDAAFALGVRYVDAARSYGRAEEFLAAWLDAHPAEAAELTIGSKWGYTYTGEWRMDAPAQEVKDHSLATLRRQLAESRTLLGRNLDLYQIHSATLESGVLDDRAVLDELRALGDDGLVVGLSVSGPHQADTIRRALDIGDTPFRSVQATWNLLEPSARVALAEAHAAGWGVIVKEALANGRLTDRPRDAATTSARELAADRGTSLDAVAIAAVLANPWVDVVLSGAATPAQLQSNVTALDLALTPEELERLGSIALGSDDYWAQRSQLPWS